MCGHKPITFCRLLNWTLTENAGIFPKEIAVMLGLTEKAVYTRLERLRHKLKPIIYLFVET